MQPALEEAKLKVLLCDSSPNWGGQEYRMLREARWLCEHGHEVLILCGEGSKIASRVPGSAPRAQLGKLRSWDCLLGLLQFLWITCRWKPDIIHAHSGQDAFWAMLFHKAGRAVVRSRHITVPPRLAALKKLPYRSGCSRVIASAEFIKKDLAAAVGIPEARLDVVGEGVDLEEFHPGVDGSRFRAEFGIPADAPLFGVVAMVRREKGHLHFVSAAAKVLEQVPGAYFVIAGDGDDARVAKVRKRVQEAFSRQPAPVIFTGYREDVPEIMAALDVLVVPSRREAQTLVIPQAFAAGKPVVASRVGGIPELVIDGTNGFLVPVGDGRALAAAMVELAKSPELRKRLGQAGLELARSELAFCKKMELLVGSYRMAIRASRRRTR